MAEKTEIINFTLYGGEVKVKFYPKSHMYKVTDPKYGLVDQRVKGVTTYLGIKDKSGPLVIWATELAGQHLISVLEKGEPVLASDIYQSIGLHQEKKEEAADIGTATHAWCEYFIKHKLGLKGFEATPQLPTDPTTLLGVESFLEFLDAHKVEFISSERICYSRKHQYIGTMDFEAVIDGKLSVGDFKTSNGLYNSVLAQMAAYQAAIEEEEEFLGTGKKYENRYAVRLSKETPEEYEARMKKKNDIRTGQGKEPKTLEEYIPFEWKVSEGREKFERDFTRGFLSAKSLLEWDQETDFYKNK